MMVMAKRRISPVDLTISATEFKARCLELLRHLEEREGVVRVTRHGRVVGELRARVRRFRPILNSWKGKVEIVGDIVRPSGEWSTGK
jgi:hypothetical protein